MLTSASHPLSYSRLLYSSSFAHTAALAECGTIFPFFRLIVIEYDLDGYLDEYF